MVCQAMCSSAQASSFQFSRKAELVTQMMVSSGQLLLAGSGGRAWGGRGMHAVMQTRGLSGCRQACLPEAQPPT